MNVEYALYHVVKKFKGGAVALAEMMGISSSSLSHKANPNDANAHASPREMIDIMVFTGDKSPLRAMAAELGEICIPMLDLEHAGAEASEVIASTVQEFSEMLTASSMPIGGRAVNDNQLAKIEREALEAIAAIHALVGLARRMNRAAKPGEAQA